MANEMRIAAHARARMSQRGVASEWDFRALDRGLKHFRDPARRLVGKRLVVDGGRIVTACHVERGKERRLLRGRARAAA
jgi:hypothetical protein